MRISYFATFAQLFDVALEIHGGLLGSVLKTLQVFSVFAEHKTHSVVHDLGNGACLIHSFELERAVQLRI